MDKPVILITGGLTGIGRAVAFAKKGATVVVAGRRDEAGKALVEELRSFGSEAEFVIRSLPSTLKHETELVMAEGDMVMLREGFSGHGQPAPWIVVDTIRMANGVLKEHWDVIEDESSREASVSGLPMFGDSFPEERRTDHQGVY